MDKKKIVIGAAIAAAVCGIFFAAANKPQENVSDTNTTVKEQKVDKIKAGKETQKSLDKKEITTAKKESKSIFKGEIEETSSVKHGNLYSETPSGMLPLSAITELANLPNDIRAKVDDIVSNSTNIFMLKRRGDKLIIVTENPDNIRHGVDFTEISVHNGHQTVTTLGYNGKIQDSENDKWEYNSNKLPTKHTKYNKDGDVEFVETWNYESANPVKYEMKNAEGKTLSIRKETVTDGSNMRVEHLVYDTNGNTKANVSATYEGADVKRFTYYNADKPSDGASVFSEYSDGMKTKETVYTSDLKVQNIYEASYQDGERENITVFDSQNNKLETLEK